jgi:hypothetical protein
MQHYSYRSHHLVALEHNLAMYYSRCVDQSLDCTGFARAVYLFSDSTTIRLATDHWKLIRPCINDWNSIIRGAIACALNSRIHNPHQPGLPFPAMSTCRLQTGNLVSDEVA